jgi:hypothetical protein
MTGLAHVGFAGVHICRDFHPFGGAGSEGFSLVLEGRWVAVTVAGALACWLGWLFARTTSGTRKLTPGLESIRESAFCFSRPRPRMT